MWSARAVFILYGAMDDQSEGEFGVVLLPSNPIHAYIERALSKNHHKSENLMRLFHPN
jgi:hypothetical protein